MCLDCLHETRPDRGTTCHERGNYILNFKQCIKCSKKTNIKITNFTHEKEFEEEDDESSDLVCETITYNHVCETCNHHISEHYYNYDIDETSQEYTMECMLCGKGGQSIKFSTFDDVYMENNSNSTDGDDNSHLLVKEVNVDEKLMSGISRTIQATTCDLSDNDDDWS